MKSFVVAYSTTHATPFFVSFLLTLPLVKPISSFASLLLIIIFMHLFLFKGCSGFIGHWSLLGEQFLPYVGYRILLYIPKNVGTLYNHQYSSRACPGCNKSQKLHEHRGTPVSCHLLQVHDFLFLSITNFPSLPRT